MVLQKAMKIVLAEFDQETICSGIAKHHLQHVLPVPVSLNKREEE
jgi:hypothetical protein